MVSNARFAERIGKVFLPEAEAIDSGQDYTPNPEGPFPEPGLPRLPGGLPEPQLPRLPAERELIPVERLWYKFCSTRLRQGCYTIGFTPSGASIFATRYRGTVRVEHMGTGLRISGDLYTYRLLDEIIVRWPVERLAVYGRVRDAVTDAGGGDEAADTGGTIPIYPRRRYHSYLKGTGARLFNIVPRGTPCSFSLDFDEFVYNHPATGFNGSFNNTRTRAIHLVLRHTGTADFYSGEAYEGTTLLGSVSIRWVSDFYRRASLQLNTLTGFEAPPASVGASTFAAIFVDAGWDLTFTDSGNVPLPAGLAGTNTTQCWSDANLHELMTSVPGYNAADLDTVWRVHLVSVPAALGCGRGVMFDSSLGADPNAVAREGSATFSRDGYPAGDCPDGMGGSHYDTAANQQQRNVPRAFLRSATHEVGHAFNQIHQNFELGSDNSIMTPTPSVATVLGTGGTFPDGITLAFNDTVKRHLRHLPDPAVRPGAMDFFGSAVSAPEASDVAWPESLTVTVDASADQVALGEPLEVRYQLTNNGEMQIPVPETLELASLTLRINVTDPSGRITFMRPATILSCPTLTLVELAPGKSIEGSTSLFWGRDGFAFETPGRHVVEVIVLWNIAGVPVASSGTTAVFVSYPVSKTDNDVAALLLDPEVGKAIATGRAWVFENAAKRIKQAISVGRNHPAAKAIASVAALQPPRRPAATKRRKTTRPRSARKRT
jgi:hypothetical protein